MKMSERTCGFLSLVGLILFLPSFTIITLKINQGNYIQELSKVLALNDMDVLTVFYRNNHIPLWYDIIDYFCIMGYVFLGVFFPLFFIKKTGKYSRANIGIIIVTLATGFADVIETTIMTAGNITDYTISTTLMKIHVLFTYVKGLIWIMFIWVLFLSVMLFCTKMTKRS